MNITKNQFQSILVGVRKFDLVLFLPESVWSIVWYFCLEHFSCGLFWTIADYLVVGQFDQCLNLPENLSIYQFKKNEAKSYRPRYDTITDHLLGPYETIGYLMVPGGSEESFFDYKFSKENYKILHSFHKKKILSSFSGTFFNRHRIEYESGLSGLSELSNVYFFLPDNYRQVGGN